MEKKLLDKYKIRDYYMIPIEVVDNVFYEFETQLKKQQEIIDKAKEYIIEYKKQFIRNDDDVVGDMQILLSILEDKKV